MKQIWQYKPNQRVTNISVRPAYRYRRHWHPLAVVGLVFAILIALAAIAGAL